VAGGDIEVPFTLENTSNRTLNLCSSGGVSMLLESADHARWPLIQHGITTDAECSGPITLRAGETRTFVERGTIRRDWPAGVSVLVGNLMWWCGKGLQCADRQFEVRRVVDVSSASGG
jgi:hypothetical protein